MIRSWQHIQERAPAAALFYSFLDECMNSFLIFPSKIRLVKGTHRETLKTMKNFELVSCTCKGVTFFTHAKRIQRGGKIPKKSFSFSKLPQNIVGLDFYHCCSDLNTLGPKNHSKKIGGKIRPRAKKGQKNQKDSFASYILK